MSWIRETLAGLDPKDTDDLVRRCDVIRSAMGSDDLTQLTLGVDALLRTTLRLLEVERRLGTAQRSER